MLLVVALALVLHAPSLSWGFYADDYGQELVLEGAEHPTLRPWNLYDFGEAPRPGEPLFEQASFPWWTSADWKVRFLRPLSSLSLALDQRLFGRFAPAHHASGLLLYALLLVLAHALFRALKLAPAVAACALAVFAFEDGSLVAVGWLANRNTLLEALFTVAAVLVLARGRELGPRRIAAALGLALGAVLCKESGLVALVLCTGFLLRESRLPAPRGSRSVLRAGAAAAALLAVAYVIAFLALGYGTRSIFYPTPWGDPLEFARRLGVMLSAGTVSLVAPFPLDLLVFAPELLVPGLVVATLLAVPLVVLVARAAPACPAAGFFAAWTLIALLPQAGAPPSDRLLFVPALGAAPLVAHFLASSLPRRASVSRGVRVAAWIVAALALPVSGAALAWRSFDFERAFDGVRSSLVDADVGARELGRRDVLLLQVPSALTALVPVTTYLFETGDDTVRWHPLQMGRRGVRWTRVDERTFDLETLDEPFLDLAFEGVFLSSRAAPVVGQRWRTVAFEIEALALEERGLRAFRVRCDEPLERSRWRFLVWRDGGLRHVPAPPIGASELIERCEPLAPMMP